MAFNNGFPMSYPQYYPQYQAPAQQNNGIIWVQGEAGAKSYLVAPNTTVQLWDSESQKIYLKSADASGMPSFKVLEYTIKGADQPKVLAPEEHYATVADLESFRSEIEEVKNRLNNIIEENEHGKPTV